MNAPPIPDLNAHASSTDASDSPTSDSHASDSHASARRLHASCGSAPLGSAQHGPAQYGPAGCGIAGQVLTTRPRLQFPHAGALPPAPAPAGRPGRPRLRVAVLLLLALVAAPLVLAAPAHADDCAGCAEPTVESLTADGGLKLQNRRGEAWWFEEGARDYLCVDAGECSTVIEPTGVQQIRNANLRLRGSSVAMTCPWGNVTGAMIFRTQQSDNTSWSVSFSMSGEFGTPLSKFSYKSEAKFGQSTTVTRVTEHRVNATAQYCHVLSVAAYFLIQDIDVPAVATRTRHYAWWTKNATTGSAVHQRGNVYVPCSSEPVTLTTRASVSVHVNTVVTICPWGCDGVSVTQGSTGLLPPPPPGVVVPPDLAEPRFTLPTPDDDEPRLAGNEGDSPGGADEPPVRVAPDEDDGR